MEGKLQMDDVEAELAEDSSREVLEQRWNRPKISSSLVSTGTCKRYRIAKNYMVAHLLPRRYCVSNSTDTR